MKQGLVYLILGFAYLPRLVVSLYTLRRYHSDWQICILVPKNDKNKLILEKICKQFYCFLKDVPIELITSHAAFIQRTRIWEWTPFDNTIVLDADTTIEGDISALWPVDEKDMVLTHVNQQTVADIIPKIKKAKGVVDDFIVNYSLNNLHLKVINGGVFAFPKNHPTMVKWYETAINIDSRIKDEIALQLLYPVSDYRIMDSRYNRSVRWADIREGTLIWHYYRGKHTHRRGIGYWWPSFKYCWDNNLANIRDWSIGIDKNVDIFCKRFNLL